MPVAQPKIAIVCDFLMTMGGAENVVLALHETFPDAPIYTALYDNTKLPAFRQLDVRSSQLQKLPRPVRRYHKLLPTLAERALKQLDLSEFDIIITSSYLHANHVTKSRPSQKIISYCHTPARYYWSHYDEYRRDPGYGKLNPIVRALMPLMIPRQRKLDYAAAQQVDLFIANSSATQARIKQYYGKSSIVIHPPVDTKRFSPSRERSDYYVTLGRQLPYKRFDLIVEACSRMGKKLKVYGDGPVHNTLVQNAGPSIEFYTDRFGDASDQAVTTALESARGFIYAAEEDFGIVQAEALAAGAPVIAYGKAGTLDIVDDQVSGVLFKQQTAEAIINAISQAEMQRFMPATLQRKAKRFDESLFITKIKKVVSDQL
ncbi:MAG: glycosyltransferase [Candidatus Saccharimonadales bacterium]